MKMSATSSVKVQCPPTQSLFNSVQLLSHDNPLKTIPTRHMTFAVKNSRMIQKSFRSPVFFFSLDIEIIAASIETHTEEEIFAGLPLEKQIG